MTINQSLYEKIDRYLLGELEGEELRLFEQQMREDEALAEEVAKQREMLDALSEHERFLNEIPAEKTKIIPIENTHKSRRILSTLGIVLAISVITFLSALYIINQKVIQSKQEKIYYQNAINEQYTELIARITNLENTVNKMELVHAIPDLGVLYLGETYFLAHIANQNPELSIVLHCTDTWIKTTVLSEKKPYFLLKAEEPCTSCFIGNIELMQVKP